MSGDSSKYSGDFVSSKLMNQICLIGSKHYRACKYQNGYITLVKIYYHMSYEHILLKVRQGC